MDQHRSCHILKLTYFPFSCTVLVMRVHARERQSLPLPFAFFYPQIGLEDAIVREVVLDRDTMSTCVGFECLLAFDRLFRRWRLLKMNEAKT